jgi:hypothetical protein
MNLRCPFLSPLPVSCSSALQRFEQKDPSEKGFFLLKPFSYFAGGRRSFGPAFVHISLRNARLSQRRRTDAYLLLRGQDPSDSGSFSFNRIWSLNVCGVIQSCFAKSWAELGCVLSVMKKECPDLLRPSEVMNKSGKCRRWGVPLVLPGKVALLSFIARILLRCLQIGQVVFFDAAFATQECFSQVTVFFCNSASCLAVFHRPRGSSAEHLKSKVVFALTNLEGEGKGLQPQSHSLLSA